MHRAVEATSHPLGVLQGLAHVQCFQQGQLVLVGQNQLGKTLKHPLALGWGLAGPAAIRECPAGGLHRAVNIGLGAARHRHQKAVVDG
jgi:hypothetical protein